MLYKNPLISSFFKHIKLWWPLKGGSAEIFCGIVEFFFSKFKKEKAEKNLQKFFAEMRKILFYFYCIAFKDIYVSTIMI